MQVKFNPFCHFNPFSHLIQSVLHNFGKVNIKLGIKLATRYNQQLPKISIFDFFRFQFQYFHIRLLSYKWQQLGLPNAQLVPVVSQYFNASDGCQLCPLANIRNLNNQAKQLYL